MKSLGFGMAAAAIPYGLLLDEETGLLRPKSRLVALNLGPGLWAHHMYNIYGVEVNKRGTLKLIDSAGYSHFIPRDLDVHIDPNVYVKKDVSFDRNGLHRTLFSQINMYPEYDRIRFS